MRRALAAACALSLVLAGGRLPAHEHLVTPERVSARLAATSGRGAPERRVACLSADERSELQARATALATDPVTGRWSTTTLVVVATLAVLVAVLVIVASTGDDQPVLPGPAPRPPQ